MGNHWIKSETTEKHWTVLKQEKEDRERAMCEAFVQAIMAGKVKPKDFLPGDK